MAVFPCRCAHTHPYILAGLVNPTAHDRCLCHCLQLPSYPQLTDDVLLGDFTGKQVFLSVTIDGYAIPHRDCCVPLGVFLLLLCLVMIESVDFDDCVIRLSSVRDVDVNWIGDFFVVCELVCVVKVDGKAPLCFTVVPRFCAYSPEPVFEPSGIPVLTFPELFVCPGQNALFNTIKPSASLCVAFCLCRDIDKPVSS
jgi:hypothetical protein